MKVKQYEIWLADLNPQIGTEAGKTRPVLIIQTDLLNKVSHPSTLICQITTNIKKNSDILRVHIERGTANVQKDCDVMIDQMRAIDNQRLVQKIGRLPEKKVDKLKENILIVLNIEMD
ncbi:MAG: type II toxin-antitoxin system PemK/MazF family toxin [SAR324 cluster bacterium]|nr:type II toxin-antitoxin system PemK/MazF family toxin [SAR324 cluster bacterium]